MEPKEFANYLEASRIAHNQATFEADTARRQRNSLFVGSVGLSVAAGFLQGAEVISGVAAEWGPRAVSAGLIIAGLTKWNECAEARDKAAFIASDVEIRSRLAGHSGFDNSTEK